MGKYFCPECQSGSSVVETRVSYARLIRRRTCSHKHRFTTIEVPHDTPKRLKNLIDWLMKNGLDPDFGSYAKEQVKAIVLGVGGDPDDDETGEKA